MVAAVSTSHDVAAYVGLPPSGGFVVLSDYGKGAARTTFPSQQPLSEMKGWLEGVLNLFPTDHEEL